MSDTTKIMVEMFSGVFVGMTLPTRYLVWNDDQPKSPRFSPSFKECFLNAKIEVVSDDTPTIPNDQQV